MIPGFHHGLRVSSLIELWLHIEAGLHDGAVRSTGETLERASKWDKLADIKDIYSISQCQIIIKILATRQPVPVYRVAWDLLCNEMQC